MVEDETVGAMGHGALLLVGIENGDDDVVIKRRAERMLGYRRFSDEVGKMNLDIKNLHWLLAVSQFDLAVDARKVLAQFWRYSEGRRLYPLFVDTLKEKEQFVATGQLSADVQVHLIHYETLTLVQSA